MKDTSRTSMTSTDLSAPSETTLWSRRVTTDHATRLADGVFAAGLAGLLVFAGKDPREEFQALASEGARSQRSAASQNAKSQPTVISVPP